MEKWTSPSQPSTPDTTTGKNDRDLFALGITHSEFRARDISLSAPLRDRTPQEVEQARVSMRRCNTTRRDEVFARQTELLRRRLAQLNEGDI